MRKWQILNREISLDKTLVMGILNVTPDSFSDGGRYASADEALRRVDEMIAEGADIIDIGGESSRPGSEPITADEEISRVTPIIEAISKRFDTPISIDTYKSAVARAAVDVGAAIVNDISAFRFDTAMPRAVAELKTGVVLMHSRGTFETLHTGAPAENIFDDVAIEFRRAIDAAHAAGIADSCVALDPGIGFGKTLEQNLALISGIGRLIKHFPAYPFLIGTSRKSFIGKLLGGAPVDQRLTGSLVTAVIAAHSGVSIVRTHDVHETVQAMRMVDTLRAS